MTILQLGSRGLDVQSLRNTLNLVLIPSPNLTPGDVFDSPTRDAVIRFQQRKGITPNGVVDPLFWSALAMETTVAARVAVTAAWNASLHPTPPPHDYSFEERVAAFVNNAELSYGVKIPLGAEFRRPEDAQKWHIAHMIKYNSFAKQKPANSQLVGGRNLIAWSHLSDPKTSWEHVRWQDFLRDANGAVPIKQGNAWAADQAPDEEKTRAGAQHPHGDDRDGH